MAYIKFSALLLLASLDLLAQDPTRFSPKSCLDSNYIMTMEHKGPFFGLLRQQFTVDKKNCIVRIIHKKFLPKEWIVDVCREPVHIKFSSATGVDVAKKDSDCINQDKTRNTSDFCSQYFDVLDVIQDDGLIFAEGDRDDLSSNHGKTFCSYLLLKKYLNESVIFSRYTDVPDIFQEKPKGKLHESVVPKEPEPPLIKKDDEEAKKSDLTEGKF